MNLAGWDTMSAAAMPLINQGLAKATTARETHFSYSEAALQVEGRFGAWRILEGGAPRLLRVAIPIEQGHLTGLRDAPVPLDGIELIVEVVLRLLPNKTGDSVELAFVFEKQTESEGQGVQVLQVVDPNDRFPFIGNALVQQTLGQALNANVAGVAQVLASIPTRGAAKDWLVTPYTDWANVQLDGGRQYLAIFGSQRKPTAKMALDKIDPDLFAGKGSAYFAASLPLFHTKLLAPFLTKDFRPRARFQAIGGGRAVMARNIPVPPPRESGALISQDRALDRAESAAAPEFIKLPVNVLTDMSRQAQGRKPRKRAAPKGPVQRMTIHELKLFCRNSGLACNVQAMAQLAAANLHLELNIQMPFTFQRKGGKIGFATDPNPKITHRTTPRKDVDIFTKSLGFTVTFVIIELAKKTVYNIARGIATRMQNINAPAQMPASWIGIRDFEASSAKLGTCFWFRDDRPV